MDVDAPAPSASVGVEGGGASLGGIDAPSVEGGVSAEMPSVGGGISGSMPGIAGDVSMPSGSVDVGVASASVDVPSASVDVPSAAPMGVAGAAPDMPSVEGGISGEVPSVDAKLAAPSVSASGVGLSADLPSAGVDASGSLLPSGGADVSASSVSGAVEGVKGAVGDPSTDVGAEVDDVEVEGPDVPSGEWKKPKKSLFGRMFGSNKGKLEVGRACAFRLRLRRLFSQRLCVAWLFWWLAASRASCAFCAACFPEGILALCRNVPLPCRQLLSVCFVQEGRPFPSSSLVCLGCIFGASA